MKSVVDGLQQWPTKMKSRKMEAAKMGAATMEAAKMEAATTEMGTSAGFTIILVATMHF